MEHDYGTSKIDKFQDANGIERGTAGQQPLALSPIIRLSLDPDHSTPVIPPLQEPLSEVSAIYDDDEWCAVSLQESHDDDEMEEADGGLNIFEQDDIMVEEELAKSLEDTTVSSAVQKEVIFYLK